MSGTRPCALVYMHPDYFGRARGRDLGAETQTNRRQRSDNDLVTCFAAPYQPDSPPRTVGYDIRFGASALSIVNLHDA